MILLLSVTKRLNTFFTYFFPNGWIHYWDVLSSVRGYDGNDLVSCFSKLLNGLHKLEIMLATSDFENENENHLIKWNEKYQNWQTWWSIGGSVQHFEGETTNYWYESKGYYSRGRVTAMSFKTKLTDLFCQKLFLLVYSFHIS